jgi:Tfp pilus assembly protein PilE
MVKAPCNLNFKGYSLMELMVAMVLTTITISSVYYSWNYMNKHVATHSRTALLEKETQRLIHLFANRLMRSTQIIEWDETSAVFVSETGEDTITYKLIGDTVYQNDTPVPILSTQTKIATFSIRDSDESAPVESPFQFLQLTLKLEHRSGDTASAVLSLKAKKNRKVDNDPFDF